MFSDVAISGDPDCTPLFKLGRPSELRLSEAAVENKQFALLLKRCTGLNQSAGCVACLDDNGCLCKRGHRYVSFREKQPIHLRSQSTIAHDGDLTDQ